ncbi:hypothetical protein ElyMa_002998100 [Elysia marginata]|uniref:Uncharacterized protein n=1 Tax=Elysia marginata TaxID=1093978 RepID=A0AAV4IBZ1_9GAST|nr:hypothetical protein ElyMa_002998100 [Elysia marginata]
MSDIGHKAGTSKKNVTDFTRRTKEIPIATRDYYITRKYIIAIVVVAVVVVVVVVVAVVVVVVVVEVVVVA